MKQKNVLTKNNDLLNVMFRGTPCILNLKNSFVLYWQLEHLSFMGRKIISP